MNELEIANQDEEISVDWRMIAFRMANKAKEIANNYLDRYEKLIATQGENAETEEKDALANRWWAANEVGKAIAKICMRLEDEEDER